MNYKIELGPKAKKAIIKLPQEISLRIIKKLKQLEENPFHYLEHYEGDGYKFRIGDYRALIDADIENRILTVRILDKRGRIYKR
ncbi:MAG: type II toxin-antitoxin system RelE/ParE family toxin [archaeon]